MRWPPMARGRCQRATPLPPIDPAPRPPASAGPEALVSDGTTTVAGDSLSMTRGAWIWRVRVGKRSGDAWQGSFGMWKTFFAVMAARTDECLTSRSGRATNDPTSRLADPPGQPKEDETVKTPEQTPFRAGLLAAMAVGALVAGSPALAADPVFPNGSDFGMVPFDGAEPAIEFSGFVDPETFASVTISTLPPEAYEPMSAALRDPETLAAQSITADAVEDRNARKRAAGGAARRHADGAGHDGAQMHNRRARRGGHRPLRGADARGGRGRGGGRRLRARHRHRRAPAAEPRGAGRRPAVPLRADRRVAADPCGDGQRRPADERAGRRAHAWLQPAAGDRHPRVEPAPGAAGGPRFAVPRSAWIARRVRRRSTGRDEGGDGRRRTGCAHSGRCDLAGRRTGGPHAADDGLPGRRLHPRDRDRARVELRRARGGPSAA